MTKIATKKENGWRWRIYYILVLLRLIFVFSPGYIHPDEFFQGGQEVLSNDLYGSEISFIPWEFDPKHSLRSILPPFIIVGIPFLILQKLGILCQSYGLIDNYISFLSGYNLLYGPRIIMFILSVIMDKFVFDIGEIHLDEGLAILLVWSSNWCTLIFTSRPFSNTLELYMLALSFYIVIVLIRGQDNNNNNNRVDIRRIILGFVLSAAVFVRFTFIVYIPVFVAFDIFTHHNGPTKVKNKIEIVIKKCFYIVTGASIGIFINIFADSLYFGFYKNNIAQIIITPLNAILYNSNKSNLANHGIHPHYTHLIVNMPMLFGALAVLFWITTIKSLVNLKEIMTSSSAENQIPKLCTGCILSSLILYSSAPHQEPRFLLPMLFPLVIQQGGGLLLSSSPVLDKSNNNNNTKKKKNSTIPFRKLFKILWILQNVILVVLFGFLHQGGVIPSLLELDSMITKSDLIKTEENISIIFWKTYMPPRFILTQAKLLTSSSNTNIDFIDIGGVGELEFQEKLDQVILLDETKRDQNYDDAECSNRNNIFLLTPGSIDIDQAASFIIEKGYKINLLKKKSPHLSFEDPPSLGGLVEENHKNKFQRFCSQFTMNIYSIQLQ